MHIVGIATEPYFYHLKIAPDLLMYYIFRVKKGLFRLSEYDTGNKTDVSKA